MKHRTTFVKLPQTHIGRSKNWKTLRIICFMLFLSLSFVAYSQITVNVKDRSLRASLKKIELVSNYKFFYNENLPELNQKISLNVKDAAIDQVMKQLLNGMELTYTHEHENVIVLVRKPQQSKQSTKKITGTIVDENGNPIVGASITVKGTSNGTITDLDGRFTLEIPLETKQLWASYIGYIDQAVLLNNKSNITISLKENIELLDEVVVVGYSTQKKVNLTGSVASVNSDVLAARPIHNAVTGLQGSLPGVSITTSTSRPGDNNTNIRIRGIGTLNNSNPLILIDGVEGNINTLNPSDIESVSVLKDAASSAIYGSRAANGVILVTTKKANKDMTPTITYSGFFALQTPTALPEMCDAVEYLTLLKEATANVGKSWGYTQEDVDAVINRTDLNDRANVNWVDELYRSTAPQHGHNVSLNGGSKSLGYYLSYGNLSTSGLFVGNGYHASRNNLRMKITTTVLDRVKIDANFGYTDVDNWTPASSDSSSDGLFYKALRSSPLTPVHFTDGGWGYGGSSGNPIAIIYDGGFINYKARETNLNLGGEVEILKGFTAKIQYATRLKDVLRKQQSNKIQHYIPDTDTPLASSSATSSISQRDVSERYQNILVQGDYERTFGKHTIHLLAGFSQEWNENQTMNASRQDLVSDDLHVLNAGTDKFDNNGMGEEWALRSGFGRINYNFDDRYLFEANLRYDLSSRFHPDHRGGYFPSVSAAWRISEEAFMERTRSWLDNLKFRLSYGTLGNQYTSSLYPYMATIEPTTSIMPIGGNISSAMRQNSASNRYITWETIKMTNLGLDMGLFNNKLNMSFDYFIKDTDDILLRVELPGILGVTEPYQNAGKVRNKGWELALSWKDKIGKNFTYGVDFNLSDVKNEVVSMGNTAEDFSGDQIRAVGYPIDAFWGFQADGLYTVDDFDYDTNTGKYTPKKSTPVIEELRTKVQPGDIKYRDLDGSGDITTKDDRTYIGSAIPRYTYSLGLNAAWKGIDFKVFLQGVGKCDGYVGGMGRHAFTEVANYPQKVHLDRWTWDNQNSHAAYPRFTYDETYNKKFSSFWIEDASYLRVKNIQLGYTLPVQKINFLSKLRINNLRVYFSGENLWTFTNFFSSYDPESPISDGGYYPITASYSFGLSITLK
ncbi:TonB-dependent receptor [uncultured Bacteroides sp.]|uniref:TonB-dependent receptor n=1 Tax=uncultured Bacteroides sp. TaxID=162156 RepID=UPI0025E33140|nr:TonB-dependent receptor [uncultured Bacteroides sp.]